MKFIEVNVRTALVVHGFDANNQEMIEAVNETEFVTKLVALERIQSISEQYLLVTGSHGRVMYWEYDMTMAVLKQRLAEAGLLVPEIKQEGC